MFLEPGGHPILIRMSWPHRVVEVVQPSLLSFHCQVLEDELSDALSTVDLPSYQQDLCIAPDHIEPPKANRPLPIPDAPPGAWQEITNFHVSKAAIEDSLGSPSYQSSLILVPERWSLNNPR